MFMKTQLEFDRMELALVHHHYQMCSRVDNLSDDELFYLTSLDVYIQARETAELKQTLGLYNHGVSEVEA